MKAVLIAGDGIGAEITGAVRRIFKAAEIPIEWIEAEAGLGATSRDPSGFPKETVDLISSHRIALKGPTATPSGSGHSSVNVLIRKTFGLFANVRPFRSMSGINQRYGDIDLIVVRENIEDTYSGIEYLQTSSVVHGVKVATQIGAEAIIRHGFELAKREGRKKVTLAHKANIHKLTDGLYLRVFEEVKTQYPEIESNDLLVDNVCMQLVTRPQQFDVIITQNLYGDILSDLAAGLVGGLGLAPSANLGNRVSVFEAVHGSAPDIAGKNLANPTALLLSAIMLLRRIGLLEDAIRVQSALEAALAAGKKTRDIGGVLGTAEFSDFVISMLTPRLSKVAPELPLFSDEGKGVVHYSEQRTLRGVDVYIHSKARPELPSKIRGFELDSVRNRGVPLAPDDKREQCDLFAARYLCTNEEGDVNALLSELSTLKLFWVNCQKLFTS